MAAKINSTKRKEIKTLLSKGKKKYSCVFCNIVFSIEELTIEHIVPKKDGGSNKIENLTLSCKICNTHRDRANFYEYISWMNDKTIDKPKGTKNGGNRNRVLKKKEKK